MNMDPNATKGIVDHCAFNYFSWKAIVAGALIAVGLTFLFNLLTLGVGLSTFVATQNGQEVLAFAGFAWMFVGGFAMLFLAGWSTGKLVNRSYANNPNALTSTSCCHSMMHGFVTWSLYLLISLTMLSNIAPSVLNNAGIANAGYEQTDTATRPGYTSLEAQSVANPQSLNAEQKDVAEQKMHKMGLATLATFFLVLAGALGAMTGACYGMSNKRCHKSDVMKTT